MVTTETHARAGQAGRERGQALAELALVTPILALLIMAVFQFAFTLQTQMGLTNAVREAARRAAAVDNPDAAYVRMQLCGDLSTCDSGLLAANVQGFAQSRLPLGAFSANGISYPDNPGVKFCTYTVNGAPNFRVDVAVRYGNAVFFPGLAYATDLMDGTGDGDWTLNAAAQMRVEHDLTGQPSC